MTRRNAVRISANVIALRPRRQAVSAVEERRQEVGAHLGEPLAQQGDVRVIDHAACGLQAQVGADLLPELVDRRRRRRASARLDAVRARRGRALTVRGPALGLARGARQVGAQALHGLVDAGAHLVGEAAHRVGHLVLDRVEFVLALRRARRARHP